MLTHAYAYATHSLAQQSSHYPTETLKEEKSGLVLHSLVVDVIKHFGGNLENLDFTLN